MARESKKKLGKIKFSDLSYEEQSPYLKQANYLIQRGYSSSESAEVIAQKIYESKHYGRTTLS